MRSLNQETALANRMRINVINKQYYTCDIVDSHQRCLIKFLQKFSHVLLNNIKRSYFFVKLPSSLQQSNKNFTDAM